MKDDIHIVVKNEKEGQRKHPSRSSSTTSKPKRQKSKPTKLVKPRKKRKSFKGATLPEKKKIIRDKAIELRAKLPEIVKRLRTYYNYERIGTIEGMDPEEFDLYINLALRNPTHKSLMKLNAQLNRYLSPNAYRIISKRKAKDYMRTLAEHYGEEEIRTAMEVTSDWTPDDWERFFRSKYYKEQNVFGSDGEESFYEEYGTIPMLAQLMWFDAEVLN